MAEQHTQFMQMALTEAAQARAAGNVAVGTIIVHHDTVVARGRNLVTSTCDPTAHAETVALREASMALRQVELAGHTLYTTFEPCPMCCGAILLSGISTLVLGARYRAGESRWGSYSVERLIELTGRSPTLAVITGILTDECYAIWRSS